MACKSTLPGIGSPVNMGRLILEAGESWGDELSSTGVMSPHQLEEVTARAEISRTPPGLMFGPSWRVGPSYVVSEVPEKGPAVPSWSDTA